MIYLDSAAAVKLIHSETDSAALRGFLDQRSDIEWVQEATVNSRIEDALRGSGG